MANTHHAIEIITDDGTGIPVTYSNSSIGLATDGHFYLITDRPGLDGSKTIAGDTSRGTWYEGVLAKNDGQDFKVDTQIDIIDVGNVASLSDFSFSIVNTGLFWNTIRVAGVHLNRCRVVYYSVSTSDQITYTFDKEWEGVIDLSSYDELTYKIQCVDSSKDIFGSSPPVSVDRNNFPRAQDDTLEKVIPIVFGRAAYSPLINVSGQGPREVLCSIDGDDITVCAVKAFDDVAKTMNLFTRGVTFTADDARLKDKYITAVKGGNGQTKKIVSNAATDAGDESTQVTLEEWWDSGTVIAWDVSIGDDTVWYFEVRDYPVELIASTKELSAFQLNALGRPAIYSYDSQSKTFTDVSEATLLTDEANIAATGYPGLKVLAKGVDSDGDISVYIPIVPRKVIAAALDNVLVDGSNAILTGDELPNLIDLSDDTYHDFLISETPDNSDFQVRVYLPENAFPKAFEAIYCLIDLDYRYNSSANPFTEIRIRPRIEDLYFRNIGKEYDEFGTTYFVIENTTGGTSFTGGKNLLPGIYFATSRDDSDFHEFKESLNFGAEIGDFETSKVFRSFLLRLTNPYVDAGHQFIFRIKEIGIVGKASVNVTRETLYAHLRGETFGTQWRSPDAPTVNRIVDIKGKATTDPIESMDEVLEHLIRNYDYNHPKRTAGNPYQVGQKVRSTADNGFIYICTVAGTSHASTEPTFPTTLGSTVTDGTVTWQALDTLKIDCASFDTLATYRSDWFVGRTLTERKSSLDLYNEINAQMFTGMFLDSDGRINVKAWREDSTPSITFNSTGIFRGTLSPIEYTPTRRAYNDLVVRYAYNPASKTYTKQLFITHADEPAFPSNTETIVPGEVIADLDQVYRLDLGNDLYRFYYVFSGAHGRTTGDYVSFTGSDYGFDHEPRQVSVTNATDFYVEGHLTSAVASYVISTDTRVVRYHTDTRMKWKTFVGGINSYALAKLLWEQCHESYVVTKTINKLPEQFGDCPWFPDPEAVDISGKRIWPDLPDGDNHPAAYYLQNLAEWTSRPKKLVSFEAPDTATNRGIKLLTAVYFNDAKLTNGSDLLGWVYHIEKLPREGKTPKRFRFHLILNPEDLSSIGIIDENGADSGDIIDENSAVSTDIIDENGA